MTTGNRCVHGCGRPSYSLNYCDECNTDSCLVGPDGVCRYTIHDDDDMTPADRVTAIAIANGLDD